MSYPRPTKDILRDLDEASATGRGLVSPSPAFAAGRLAGLREAAEVARSPDHTLDWRARERIAASILALAEGKEG